ncbi:uncharacterized protein C2845_PM08G14960 [Panicum miliaceum]|uniref:Uncharacterized protein n=1 Tax=Panicum miliaceum TaxID=4540 RepID=A0A3L6QXU4_PANMI|nr:uncharacterized protein C2845_PM08G14960 [Panicum miliaceum]
MEAAFNTTYLHAADLDRDDWKNPGDLRPPFGHIEKSCNATQAELEQELSPPRPRKGKKLRKNKSEAVETSTTQPETSKVVAESSPMPHSSPGVTTRRMPSLSPTSPGVTT